MAKTPEPIAPRHPHNPVGQTEKISRAMKAVRKDLLRLQKDVIREWEAMPVSVQNAAFYEYLIDLAALRAIVARVRNGVTQGEGARQMARQTEAAYVNGTAMAAGNLSRLTDDYTRQVTAHLGSQIVQRRAALAGARVYEQMEGFAGDLATQIGRVMFSAVQSGENPRETAKRLRGRFGVSKSRAERIARTEITGALRRGRWDEARDAQDKFGFETRLIHYSALISGRTRDSHARRHGQIVTIEDQARWYERDGNAINCLCSSTEVIVDSNGKPVTGDKLRDRMGQAKAKFERESKVDE